MIFGGWKDESGNLYTSKRTKTLVVIENTILTAVWNSPDAKTTAQFEITIPPVETSDIQVVVKVDGTAITTTGTIDFANTNSSIVLEADSSYTTYIWKINNQLVQTNNTSTLTLQASEIQGVCDITLLASKTTDKETIYHSYTVQIKKTEE